MNTHDELVGIAVAAEGPIRNLRSQWDVFYPYAVRVLERESPPDHREMAALLYSVSEANKVIRRLSDAIA
ncbi:hypothetical protein ACXIUS_05340 [Bosea thiooxidans]|nr:hypothetical protein [Bosea sp. (in: a-proteobacteria)]